MIQSDLEPNVDMLPDCMMNELLKEVNQDVVNPYDDNVCQDMIELSTQNDIEPLQQDKQLEEVPYDLQDESKQIQENSIIATHDKSIGDDTLCASSIVTKHEKSTWDDILYDEFCKNMDGTPSNNSMVATHNKLIGDDTLYVSSIE